MTRNILIVSVLTSILSAGLVAAKGHDQSQASSDARIGDGSAPGESVDVTTTGAQGLGHVLGERPTATPPGQAKKAE